jgi:hypothetical protein
MYFAKKHYIPYILHPHGTLSETRIASRKSFLKKILLGLFAPYFANAKSIIALTEQEKIEINAISPDAHIDIVANGVEVDSIKKKFSLQELLNISSTTKVITYMGRIQYIK